MKSFLPFVGIILSPLFGFGLLKVIDGYHEGTVGKERTEQLQHRTKCNELRAEFFSECQKTASRHQCEAWYGQTRGQLFDGPPEFPMVREWNCEPADQ